MSTTFLYPSLKVVREIARDRLNDLNRNSAVGALFPIGTFKGKAVVWQKRDSLTGVLPARNAGSPLPVINGKGGTRYAVPTSFFGGQMPMDVDKIISGASYQNDSQPIDLGGEAEEMMNDLIFRQNQTIDYQLMRMLGDGNIYTFNVDDAGDVTTESTFYWNEWQDRTLALSSGTWDSSSTCDPFRDFRNISDTYFRKEGYSLFKGGKIMLSSKLANVMLESDAVKKNIKSRFGSSVLGIDDFNDAYRGIAPAIEVIDGGTYLGKDANGETEFAPYIDDNKVIFVGAHSQRGTQLGEWDMTTSDMAGIGEDIYAEIVKGKDFPYNPIAQLAFQGAPNFYSEKQIFVLEVADIGDINNFYG
jgi:hypothetical protein